MEFIIEIKLNNNEIIKSLNTSENNIINCNYLKINIPVNTYNQYKKLLPNPIKEITYFIPNTNTNILYYNKYINNNNKINFPYYFISGSELLWTWQLGYLNNMIKNISNKIYFSICLSGRSLANCLNLCEIDINNVIYDIKIFMDNNRVYSLNKKILGFLE